MSDSVRINGTQISWQSVSLKINGVPYTGITGIEFGDKRERSLAYGLGRHGAPRGKTAGKYDPGTLAITAWKSTAQAMRERLAALASDGVSYGNVSVPVVLQYVEPSDGVITCEFTDCTWQEASATDEEGPDGLAEKITLLPTRVLRNGLALYDATIQGSGA